MFDPLLRRLVGPPLARAGAWLAARGASANAMTLGGLGIGLLSVPLLACGAFGPALHGEVDDGKRGRKSFFFSAGIIEGSETIFAFVLFCLFPSAFPWLAATMALLCFWTAAARVVDGFRAGADNHD